MIFFFFFNDPATTEIYTLSLHDALPIWLGADPDVGRVVVPVRRPLDRSVPPNAEPVVVDFARLDDHPDLDRKSTRLNSSHSQISYAVFCLKKKKKIRRER